MDTSCEDISKIDCSVCRPTYTEEFPHPVLEHGRYAIPWSDWRRPKISWKLIKFLTVTKKGSNIPSQDVLDVTLPVMKPDLSQFSISPCSGVRHMWIGHATSLVQLDGVTFLTDPIFSVRASPAQWVGYKRYRPPPCTIEELPQIDCVIISHNHYDHLDYRSVVGLNKRSEYNEIKETEETGNLYTERKAKEDLQRKKFLSSNSCGPLTS